MGNEYFKGLYGTFSVTGFMNGTISENQIDAIKEFVTRCCESRIDDLPLSEHEKEEKKYNVKQSADAYNHGIKDALRMVGRLA